MSGAGAPSRGRRWRRAALLGLLVVAGLAGSRTYRISAAAMMPTLGEGDIVLAAPGSFWRHEPQRGDLAIFLLPDEDTATLRRIVGMPGDRIELRGGRVIVNDRPIDREWVESAIRTDAAGEARSETRFIEEVAGRRYQILIGDETAAIENIGPVEVPPDHYFALADNRDDASDSRGTERPGLLPRNAIIDRPALILWSRDRARIGRWVE